MAETIPIDDILNYDDMDITMPVDSVLVLNDEQILDAKWSRKAFLVNDSDLSGDGEDGQGSMDSTYKYYSTASAKFTDTRLGGSIGVNARPQFTYYSDIPVKGKKGGHCDEDELSIRVSNKGYGLGRYYSESIDDNAQTIYMRFGVPQYNSFLGFFARAFDPYNVILARSGRAPSATYMLGYTVGSIANFAVSMAAAKTFPIAACSLILARFLPWWNQDPSSKFYTMKPTMHLYWSAVNNLVNMVAINKGIIPATYINGNDPSKATGIVRSKLANMMNAGKEIMNKTTNNGEADVPPKPVPTAKVDSEGTAALRDLDDEVFNESGYDMFAFATRAQRLANKLEEDFHDEADKDGMNVSSYIKALANLFTSIAQEPPKKFPSLMNFVQDYVEKSAIYGSPKDEDDKPNNVSAERNIFINKNEDYVVGSDQNVTSMGEYLKAEYQSGASYVAFKVDPTGSVGESFSSSVGESDLSNKYNSTVSQSREARFTFAGGNIMEGALGTVIQGVVTGVTDLVAGAVNSVDILRGIAGLFGTSYLDIPKNWQNSTAKLSSSSYTMQLISPYGNPLSQMQNIYIPICMLLAAALPVSTGRQSYTSPFLCQLFDRGRCQIRLGMITSLSITRGTSNLPFTKQGNALAVDVNFEVEDLSSILHVPIASGSVFEGNVATDPDNALMDYLAVLAGQDMYSQLFPFPRARLNMIKTFHTYNKLNSSAYWASVMHHETTAGFLASMMPINPAVFAEGFLAEYGGGAATITR